MAVHFACVANVYNVDLFCGSIHFDLGCWFYPCGIGECRYRYQFNTVLLCILLRERLMSVLRALVNNPIKVSFDINFMGTEKNCQNINCFFFFPHKNFL